VGPAGVDQLDSAGQTILQLLNKAANVAEQNSKHAIDMAQKLAHELRAAQQRISELEALSSETKCNTPDLISAGLIETLGSVAMHCYSQMPGFQDPFLATLKELGKDVQIRFA
jgi:hypothetical protein